MPERTCIGCRAKLPIAELTRISGTGARLVAGAGPGRGAWLCRGSESCFTRARGRSAFAHALRAEVSEAAVEALRASLRLGATDSPR